MSDLDRYDVEAMISLALHDYATKRELGHVERELRDAIGSERVERQDADESLVRVLNSRTEHLA